MNEFIAQNPAVISAFIGFLFAVLGIAAGTVIFFLKKTFKDLIKAITDLQKTLDGSKTDIGILKDRMQAIETTCKTMEKICPNRGNCSPPIMVHRRNSDEK